MQTDPPDDEYSDGLIAPPSIPPAEGERRAIGGYYPQYRLAAILILQALRQDHLEWIRVADPDAGRVDDFQIGGSSRVDAYQIKWSSHPGTVTFKDVAEASGETPSLIQQLADGWSRLQQRHPGERVVVHLATNKRPSVDDKLPYDQAPPEPRHFDAFMQQVWTQAREKGAGWQIPPEWQPAWDTLRSATDLSETGFSDFVQACKLEFRVDIDGYANENGRDAELHDRQIKEVIEYLLREVAHPSQTVEISRNDLLSDLNWSDRLEMRSTHEFPVDQARYEPIQATTTQLDRALDELAGGYVAVVGDPGSGKSTLLTEKLRNRPERVLRYYAYVPDSSSVHRAQAVSFLHDLTQQIDRAGFRPGKAIDRFDCSQLLDRLQTQLQLLHENWEENRRKTLILVDGLDHVLRQPNIEQPLLAVLPAVVPEGVLFLLGTQTTDLQHLAPDIKQQVRQPDRRIEMQRLTREQTHSIVSRVFEHLTLTAEQYDRIYEASDGHPLMLNYFMNQMASLPNGDSVGAVLDQFQPYDGDIERYYFALWDEVEPDDELVRLLGLLARMRNHIDLAWVRTWCKGATEIRLRRTASHLFLRETDDRWYFFHDSFRQFLLQKTEQACGGNKALHADLAEQCAESDHRYWNWQELYHRWEAGEYTAVVRLATQCRFRGQFMALRPADSIEEDIKLALRAASKGPDTVAFARAILAGSELFQRRQNIESAEPINLFLNLQNPEEAIRRIRRGKKLLVSRNTALEVSGKLKALDLDQEAKTVFGLAEPLNLLSGSPVDETTSPEDQEELLLTWARVACHFRSFSDVINQIRKVRVEDSRLGQMSPEDATDCFRCEMLFQTGLALLQMDRIQDFDRVINALAPEEKDFDERWAWLHVHGWRHLMSRDNDSARQMVMNLLEHVDDLTAEEELTIYIAEATYRLLGDEKRARELIRNVPQPSFGADAPSVNAGLEPFLDRFRLNRLLTALGEGMTPEEAVREPDRPEDRGMATFERAVVRLARMWGRHWRHDAPDLQAFAYEARQLLDVFQRDPAAAGRQYLWYAVEAACGDFCRALISLAEELGPRFVNALRDEFQQRWQDPRTAEFWSPAVRRTTTVEFGGLLAHRQWAIERLQSLENRSHQNEDAIQRIEHYKQQAEAWVKLKETEKARDALHSMLEHSFGVLSHKDHQLNAWLEWLPEINDADSASTADRIRWFAGAALAMNTFADSRATADVGHHLLATAFSWHPPSGLVLFERFTGAGILNHDRAVLALIRATIEADSSPIDILTHLLADFVFATATDSDAQIARRLASAVHDRLPEREAMDRVRYVAEQSQVHALCSARSAWRQGLAQACYEAGVEFQTVALSEDDLRPTPDDHNSPRILKLDSGEVLSMPEVLQRYTNPAELQFLYESEHEDSHLDWPATVKHLVPCLNRRQINEVADIFQEGRDRALVLTSLAQRVFELGDGEDARNLAEQALDASAPMGWDQYWDGGSRLKAAQAIVAIDPGARPTVIDTLVGDLLSEFWWPMNIARNLKEIIPLLTDEVPILELWQEIKEYLGALFEDVEFPDVDIIGETPDLPDDTPGDALAHLIGSHIAHPCSTVSQAAQRTCGELLLKRNARMQEAFRRLLIGSDNDQQHAAIVLDAVSVEDPEAVSVFRSEVDALRDSPNYMIRAAAKRICERAGWSVPTDVDETADLPSVYDLELPRADLPRDDQRILPAPGEAMPDSSDPLVIVQPFDNEIAGVAEITGLPWTNICHRVVRIMRDLSPQEEWSAKTERRLQAHLTAVNLRFPFTRPRAALVRRALFHAVGEIVSAASLSEDAVDTLRHILRCYDPAMVFVDPCPQPDEIASLDDGDENDNFSQNWVSRVETALPEAATNMGDGQTVVAEYTELRRLERPGPKGVRRSCIYPRMVVLSDPKRDYETVCRTVSNRMVCEYHGLGRGRPLVPLIIENRARGFLTPGSGWLALNPAIGRQLGWRSSHDGLLGWMNDDGTRMVHTVWWRQGHPDAGHYRRDEVGEGWLVLASKEAVSILENKFGDLRRAIVIERSLEESDDAIDVASKTENI